MDTANASTELLSVLGTPLLMIGTTEVTGTRIVVATMIVIATLVGCALLRRWVVRVFEKRGSSDDETIRTYVLFTQFLVLFIGIGIALHIVGINMTKAFAAGGIFALTIGFAVKNLAENFISGVILRFEHSISKGDVIDVGGRMVKVSHLGTRVTTARTLDDEDILIPNSKLVQSEVINYTLRDARYRLGTRVGVSHTTDLDLVLTTLEEAIAAIDWRSSEQDPVVQLESFGDASMVFDVFVWIDDPWTSADRRSDLNQVVGRSLSAAGISMARS